MPILVEKTNNLKYKFSPSNQNFGDIVCEVLIHSTQSSAKFEVRKLTISLPKFWKWGLDPTIHNTILGKLRFKLIERNARFLMWIKQCFLVNIS